MEDTANTVVRQLWGTHVDLLPPDTYMKLLKGDKIDTLPSDQASHGAPLDTSATLKIVSDALALVNIAVAIYNQMEKEAGRKPKTKELEAHVKVDPRIKMLAQPVLNKLSKAIDLTVDMLNKINP